MNNPFDYVPTRECDEAYARLLTRLDRLKDSRADADVALWRELEAGKMLGVLIATDAAGERHVLYAFSGQLGEAGFHHPEFVEPVFDYLQPDGYFKRKEREISQQNIEISRFEAEVLPDMRRAYQAAKEEFEPELLRYKEQCRLSKSARDAKRAAGVDDAEELAEMVRLSQFEKAELRRIKKRVEGQLAPYASALQEAEAHLEALKDKRRADSEALQQWLFSNFTLLNARGESRSLSDIFAETALGVPPSGAGECCAPKLLQAAYRRGWKPVAMAEYWHGKSKGGDVRLHGEYYPACRGKCLPVLGWMLQGVEVVPPLTDTPRALSYPEPKIIFENQWFCVVDKPSGMLSVPGKGGEQSVEQWLHEKYGEERDVRMAHRLDQDTSGLLIAAFGTLALKVLQRMFGTRQVEKTYIADLDGDYMVRGVPRTGRIELPLTPDWLDRPRQRVDFREGKEAVTDYEFISTVEGRSRVIFHPHTGRTHQLRVHSASSSGLAMPIVGDRLYGSHTGRRVEHLHLHAHRLQFLFPIDRRTYTFESPVPF